MFKSLFGSSALTGFSPKPKSNTKPGGTTSVEHHGGYVTSKERNPKLREKRRYQEFNEMILNQPVIGAGVRTFFAVMKQVEWTVVPIEGDADSERYAEAVQEVIDNLESGWPQVIQKIAGYVFFGFSVQEWTALRLPSGVIGFKDIAPRAQHTIERWEIQDDGSITGLTQRNVNSSEELYLERRRLVYAVDDALTDNPEGLGLFRQLYATYQRLETYKVIEEIGFDNDLRGVPVARVPLAELEKMVENGIITPERKSEIIEVYREFLRNHQKKRSQGFMHESETFTSPDGDVSDVRKYDIELLRGDGSSALADLQAAIRRERNNLAMLLSTGFLMLGEDGAGSLALSQTKIDSFFLFVTATLQYIAFVLKRDVIKALATLNGWDETSLPEFQFEEPKAQNIVEITEALRNAAAAFGPLPSAPETINKILTMIGLPTIDEDEFEAMMEDLDLMPGNRGGATNQGGEEQDPEADLERNGDNGNGND